MTAANTPDRMPLVPALEVLRELRRDEIVVTTMGTAREWPRLSQHPLDFHFVPSAMGQAPSLGLGLALAQPQREVIVLNGDGCTLMSPGCLATIVASGAKNIAVIVFDNGIYEVTGGQKTAAAVGHVDFAALAAACGFTSVRRYSDLAAWQVEARSALYLPGPRFISLSIEPVGPNYHLEPPGPMAERLARFRAALGTA
jgi:thiamine pyrophosphate-dependent acetolactate synthase large subunit-like protein